ncbi:MAG: NAD(P)H-hydrate epimerase, partial [Desulfobacterales bacterium]
MYLVTTREMQAMDRRTIDSFGLPGRILMENAGRGATAVILDTFPDLAARRVGVIAGPGNNGGDGYVIARCLSQRDVTVTVFLLADRARSAGDAAANLD